MSAYVCLATAVGLGIAGGSKSYLLVHCISPEKDTLRGNYGAKAKRKNSRLRERWALVGNTYHLSNMYMYMHMHKSRPFV